MNFKRVHIFGGAGSGKTTLAQRYAKKYGLPHHELDKIYYSKAPARERRARAKREQLLAEIVKTDEWVLDGIFWQPWVQPALQRADKIVVLAIPEFTRHLRVVRRHLQLLRHASPGDLPTFFPTLFELLKHNRTYTAGPLEETLDLVSDFGSKVSVCEKSSQAAQVLHLV